METLLFLHFPQEHRKCISEIRHFLVFSTNAQHYKHNYAIFIVILIAKTFILVIYLYRKLVKNAM